ncbi:zinc finger protein ZAT9-like [Papaver somniferum]|uniref:zinc finger protein ZAT9-like n=1 Tax=Papaver somniferum TaxID=3469 RepID=UPI000E6FBC19|nr:zinc finger protein ZAT9-like [Papaver somniferum]
MEVRDALLHVNSFVSLKELGEEDTKIFELTEVDDCDELHLRNCTCAEDGDLPVCKENPSQSRTKGPPNSIGYENGIQNYSIHNSGSDIKQKSSPATSDGQRNSPSSSSDAQRPSTSDAQRSSPSTSEKSKAVFPQWEETGKRGRKRSSTSTSSIEKQKEPVFGEKELVETLMHLWALSNSYSIDSANSKKDKSTRFPVTKKRKLQDIVCTKDGLKKARIEKETEEDYRCEIMLDTGKKTYSEASNQQITTLSSASETFNCAFCGKSFNSYQALGGHKSSCKSNPLKKQVVKSAVQDSVATSKIYECKICSKMFQTGQALGGHQKSHKTGEVEPSRSSVSPPPKEINESLHLIQSSTLSVREEQSEALNKKIMMFDLNENPPEDDDETELKL